MGNVQEVANVKKALDLEIVIAEKEKQLARLEGETFRDAPAAPTKKVWEAQYPVVKSKLTISEFFKSLSVWEWLVGLCVWPYLVWQYFQKKKENTERIRNSEAYKQQCAAIDRDIAEKQAKSDTEYEAALQNYNTVTIPQYQKELEAWSEEHDKEILKTKSALREARAALTEHYENTKILPMQYRKIETIQYIYDMISSSDYNVKQAIDLYDRNEERKLNEARLREQQISNEQQKVANELAEQQADLLQEQNRIAEKARRDSNIAAAIGTVQRHNLNKKLKK